MIFFHIAEPEVLSCMVNNPGRQQHVGVAASGSSNSSNPLLAQFFLARAVTALDTIMPLCS